MAGLNKFIHLLAAGCVMGLLSSAPVFSSTISGIIWNDSDMDGIRDAGEPVITNATVYLSDISPQLIIATNITGVDGTYSFTGMTNGSYRVYASVTPNYGITIANAGGDDSIDSDAVTYSFSTQAAGTAPINYSGTSISNIDAGFIPYSPRLHITAQAGNARNGNTLFVTNGTAVPFTYVVSNSGNIALSAILVYDNNLDDFVGEISCPLTLPSITDLSYSFSNIRIINSSETNFIEATGFAVNPLFCSEINELDPAFSYTQTVVIVVSDIGDSDGDAIPNAWEIRYQLNPLESNAPDANADSDWMTDREEYLADTDPTNAASFYPLYDITSEGSSVIVESTSVDRVYGIYSTAELLDDPQYWAPVAPEQTGTGATITFTITNNIPGANYRTGVRLP
jgi:SdrD B-like domain